ncbi:MAG: phosphotransferase family protein [Candidatus Sericytochromatia bacterium]
MSASTLPPEMTLDAYGAYRKDVEGWLPHLAELARRHGLNDELTPILSGSNLIATAGPEVILKVYAPPFATDFAVELAGLKAAHGRLGVPVPEVLDEGVHHGWPYMVLRRLPGVMMQTAWKHVSAPERVRLAEQLGEVVRALHGLPLEHVEPLRMEWPAFVRRQAAGSMALQREAGLSEAWLDQLPEYLRHAEAEAAREFAPVLLHADLTDHNLLVVEEDGRWSLSAVLDFADATVGPREYELMAACIGGLDAEPGLLRPFLLAAGFDSEELGPEFRRRAFLYTLLHRFTHLPGIMRRARISPEVATFEALEAAMWPL